MPKPVRRAVFAGLLLIVAFAVYGVTSLPTAPSATSPEYRPKITPEPNGQVPQQGQIVIDLPAGFAGQLTVGQKVIPDDQLNGKDDKKPQSFTQLIFQPRPGKALEYFPGGQNCASFVYWRRDTPDQRFTENWCFTAV